MGEARLCHGRRFLANGDRACASSPDTDIGIDFDAGGGTEAWSERTHLAKHPNLADAMSDRARQAARKQSVAKALAKEPGSEEIARTGFVPGMADSPADAEQRADYCAEQIYRRTTARVMTKDEARQALAEALPEAQQVAEERYLMRLPPKIATPLATWLKQQRQGSHGVSEGKA